MRLLAVAGAHAGTVRDYDYPAAAAALATGTAKLLTSQAVEVRRVEPPTDLTARVAPKAPKAVRLRRITR